ncbi:MFS transporter [Microbacterium sp. NPDC091662]|uniref:MFS transporter n=1 Tax=Microbacterium sp. NPDC091662 TaxID=3364211 RepID=UPI003829F87C
MTSTLHELATRKAMRRLLPLLGTAYFFSYIDRTNVALAKTQLEADVGISAAAYGLGAGLFFVSYALLEVPSNLVLYRVGARIWIGRIAVTWGLVSAAMMFVQGPISFYVLRFLLGAAEAGLYPALMYLVTQWFAPKHRVRIVGLLYTAPALAMIIGGPVGGGLMSLDGIGDLHGWQWMFLIEGLLTVVVGVVVWVLLPDTPSQARWLSDSEARELKTHATAGDHSSPTRLRGNFRIAFGRPVILILAGVYFLNQIIASAVGFNLPSIIEGFGVNSPLVVGAITGSMGVAALIGVFLLPWLHERTGNDTRLIIACAALTTITLTGYSLFPGPMARLLFLFLTNIFLLGMLPLFWSVAMSRMSGLMAAAGLAFINMIGLLGGFVGPFAYGLLEGVGVIANPLFLLATCMAMVLFAILLAQLIRKEAPPSSTITPATTKEIQ